MQMRKKMLKNQFKTLMTGTALLAALIAVSVQAQDNSSSREIDAVWTQSDGIRPEIFYSHARSGIWSEPFMITDDYYDNMYPVIDQDSSGKKWLFWSAYDNQRMDIRYTTGKDGKWTDAETLETAMQLNTAPSVIIDKSDVVWLVWSANSDGAGDVFCATNKDGVWSSPILVNEVNTTPDVLPVIELNDENRPVVSWKGMSDGKIVDLISEWDGEGWSKAAIVTEDEARKEAGELASDMVELPDFMPASGLVFLRVY